MDRCLASVLVVDDDPDIREVLADRLAALGCEVSTASGGKEALALVDRQFPEMVLLDVEMPEMNGLEVLKRIQARGRDVTVVMITAYGTIEMAVQTMKEGACDFIPKPFEPDHIVLIARKVLERDGLRRKIEVLAEEVGKRHRMVLGNSASMDQAVGLAKKAAQSASTILLLGESGTGKEIFARAIHAWSARRDKPFVAINCVGLSKELLESELFGHQKGSFTGASELKKGKIEVANGGTVFLDEVGDISAEVQSKLLRFLQERDFERVGGTKTISVDVRIVAATNRDLPAAVQRGAFREDLFYRLNVIPIALPPLRERKEDIPILAKFFLQRSAAETKNRFTGITEEGERKLLSYDWPGNVRELANVIERSVALAQGPLLTAQDLAVAVPSSQAMMGRDVLSYREAIDSYRREVICKALARTRGNRAAAARMLGLQRTYLSRLIKILRIN